MSVEAASRPVCACGEPILFKPAERTVCGRCELWGPPVPVVASVGRVLVERTPVACAGCGRSVVDGEATALPLADGYCLGCRLDGVHER